MDDIFEEDSTVVALDTKTCKITLRGFEEMKKELEKYKAEQILTLERLQNAKELGDLSENAEYAEAKSSMRHNDAMISDLSISIASSIPISELKSKDTVDFGAEVSLEVTSQDNQISKRKYVVVGELEGDIDQNRISINTPLVQILLGKGVSESFVFNNKTYKILKIVYDNKNVLPE